MHEKYEYIPSDPMPLRSTIYTLADRDGDDDGKELQHSLRISQRKLSLYSRVQK